MKTVSICYFVRLNILSDDKICVLFNISFIDFGDFGLNFSELFLPVLGYAYF